VIRSKWRKNQKRGAVPTASGTRAVIELDTVAFGHLVAFTGIDIYTKEADVLLPPTLTSHDGGVFLGAAMSRRFTGHVAVVQTDGGGPSSKTRLQRTCVTIVIGIALPGRRRSTSTRILQASIVRCARNVWAGRGIALMSCRTCFLGSRRFSTAISTTARI